MKRSDVLLLMEFQLVGRRDVMGRCRVRSRKENGPVRIEDGGLTVGQDLARTVLCAGVGGQRGGGGR